MYVIHEKFTDYDNNEREEDFYFNFTEAELTHMQLEKIGGLAAMLQKIIATKDVPKLMNLYEQILQKSYGEKTPDGRGFHKSKELTQNFMETEAYSQIYMRLATDTKAAQDFINHVIPKKMQDQAKLAEQQAHPIPMNK